MEQIVLFEQTSFVICPKRALYNNSSPKREHKSFPLTVVRKTFEDKQDPDSGCFPSATRQIKHAEDSRFDLSSVSSGTSSHRKLVF